MSANRDESGRFTAAEVEPPTEDADVSDRTSERTSFTPEEMAKARNEAARYRVQLRATEQTVSQLRERVDGHDRAEALRLATGKLLDPEDLFVGRELDALRGEDGALSAELVDQAIKQIATDHPHWVQPTPSFDGGARTPVQSAGSFGDRLKAIASGRA